MAAEVVDVRLERRHRARREDLEERIAAILRDLVVEQRQPDPTRGESRPPAVEGCACETRDLPHPQPDIRHACENTPCPLLGRFLI